MGLDQNKLICNTQNIVRLGEIANIFGGVVTFPGLRDVACSFQFVFRGDSYAKDVRRGFQKVVAYWRTTAVFGVFWRVFID